MRLDVLVTPGLGDSGYVLVSGDEAVVVDPQRDARRFLDAAASHGARIRHVLETHVHNDYVTGALEIREAAGAAVAGPASAGYAFAFTPMEDGTELVVGDLTLTAIATPGHTPEHTAYAVADAGSSTPTAIFSGGSLIVGSAGRTDLLGADRAEELARAQFHSLRRLASFPDATAVLPTHGAGSFCATAPPGERRTSSIGTERAENPALGVTDEAGFLRQQLAGLDRYPAYYAHIAPINRAGPEVLGGVPIPPARTVDDIVAAMGHGAWLVDGRGGDAFAEAHVPGSLNVPLEDTFASYVGWLVPFGAPVVLLAPDPAGLVEASTQLFRIGVAPIAHLEGGLEAWRAAGRATASYPTIDVAGLVAELEAGASGDVVDVRQPSEWNAGHLARSRHTFVGDVTTELDTFRRDATTTVICASGYRSAMAASLMDRAGLPVRLVPRSGVPRALRMQRSS
jgi:glyoxylase-like metal-dependent hydrolase (beta-lactamase superfamily II)/rhodanese-related sulfurtransferase